MMPIFAAAQYRQKSMPLGLNLHGHTQDFANPQNRVLHG